MDLTSLLLKYVAVATLILLSVPMLESLLYQRSLVFIRDLQAYHTDQLTDLMNWFSFLGDGEIYFGLTCLYYAFGRQHEFMYFSITFGIQMHWINWLKLYFRSSRP